MRARSSIALALVCAFLLADRSTAQGGRCPSHESVAASFAALSGKCGASLTDAQKGQMTVIGQFLTSVIKFSKESVSILKVKPNEVDDKLAKLLPTTFLNNMLASVGSGGVPPNVATRPAAPTTRVAGSAAPLNTASFLESELPGPGGADKPANGNPATAATLTGPAAMQPAVGSADVVNPGAQPNLGCNDAFLQALAAASCTITGLPLLDQLIGGFAKSFTAAAPSLAKLGEWAQMIERQVAAIDQRLEKKPAGYEAPPPPPTGPAKAAPQPAAPGAPAVPGAPTPRPAVPGAPAVVPGAPVRPGSFLQMRSRRVNLRHTLKSPNFPTIYQDGAKWITRMRCNDPTAATDMRVLTTATNGCSVPGGWYLYIGTFTDACQIHDICYGCPTLGTRKTCDNEFYDNMVNLCPDKYCRKYLDAIQRGFCIDVALDYWTAVRGFGGGHAATADQPYCSKPCPARMAHFRIRWDKKYC